MMSPEQAVLLAYIDQQLPSYHAAWKDAAFHMQQADFRRLQDYIQALWQEQGLLIAENDQNASLLVATHALPEAHTLLLSTHYDRAAALKPQSLFLIACLSALDAYRVCVGSLPVQIKWLFSQENTAMCEQQVQALLGWTPELRADGCIWYESGQGWGIEKNSPALALGAKGVLSVELRAHTAVLPLPTRYGTIAPNAAWRLLWALNSLKDAREEILIDGFYDHLQSFEDATMDAVAKLSDRFALLTKAWGVQQLLSGLQGMQVHYAHLLTPTCTITRLSTDRSPDGQAGIPNNASAQVDFHLVPEQDPGVLFARLRQHLDTRGFADIEARMLTASKPVSTAMSHPFAQAVCRATQTAYQREPQVTPLVADALPLLAALRQQSNMPVVVITTDPTQEQDDEEDELEERRQLALLIKQIACCLWEMRSVIEKTSQS